MGLVLAVFLDRPFSARPGWALALLVLLASGCSAPAPELPYQHVVLVTIDTLRADHLSVYGYPRKTSPFIDSLAQRGTIFETAIAGASHTAPSHASMLTGLYPFQHGVLKNGDRLPEETVSLVSGMRERGYTTGAFVSARFVRNLGRYIFDEMDGSHVRSSEETIGEALEWLADQKRPVFLWVHLFDVHEWDHLESAPAEYLAPVLESGPDPARLYEHLRRTHGYDEDGPAAEVVQGGQDAVLKWIDHYDALIRKVDAQVERLHQAVSARGGNSLWLITSDHGEGLGSHDYDGHGRLLYEEQIRVPLIVHASDGVGAGRRVDEVVHHVDLRPTLTEWLELPLAAVEQTEVEARSLLPLIRGQAALEGERVLVSQRRPVFDMQGWEQEDVYVLRQGPNKYIFHSERDDEFYDLDADPREARNLLGAGKKAAIAETLEDRARTLFPLVHGRGSPDIPEDVEDELRALGYIQ